jgi:hypothetical protein
MSVHPKVELHKERVKQNKMLELPKDFAKQRIMWIQEKLS